MDEQLLSEIVTAAVLFVGLGFVGLLVTSIITICRTYTRFVTDMNQITAKLIEEQRKQTEKEYQIEVRLRLLEKQLKQIEKEQFKQNEKSRIYS